MNLEAQVSRRRFVIGAASAVGLCWVPARAGFGTAEPSAWASQTRTALDQGHAWLWDAQTRDGRFPSATYGLLASGQSLTPFALESLLFAPPELLSARGGEIARAFAGKSARITTF